MVQSLDFRPVYNSVNIQIKKPEVNAGNTETSLVNDNGIYNAVKIDIDNPRVNTNPKEYDYPVNDNIITYNQLNRCNPNIPKELPLAENVYQQSVINSEEQEAVEDEDKSLVPAPNYTTVENEKGAAVDEDDSTKEVAFHSVKKKPEIIPSEEIKPSVDIPQVLSKLESSDFDEQAVQMEKITRATLENPKNADPYIVRDVFNSLIGIVKKDSLTLQGPTEKQIEARKKIIANFIAEETGKQQNSPIKLPFKISEEEIKIANTISPMEQAERNKQYAMYTISVLAKVYIDEIQKETGDVVPFTDVPGISEIVNAFRYNPNPAVKVAALDSLNYLNRPEYKDELNTIFNIAKNDSNPRVARIAQEFTTEK